MILFNSINVSNSHAAIMAAILEHSGHLQKYHSMMTFAECSKFVFYMFSENADSNIVSAISYASKEHMNNLVNEFKQIVTNHNWIYTYPKYKLQRELKQINNTWSFWSPSDNVGKMMKASFDGILRNASLVL